MGTVFDAAALLGSNYTYNWQPGPDTSTITFAQNGMYQLRVTDQYGCFTKKALNVTLAAPGDAGFSTAQVDNSSTWSFVPNDPNADSYLWNFGDGNSSTEQNPQHHYAALGTYLVTLTTEDAVGCPAQTTQQSVPFLFSSASNLADLQGFVYPNPFQEKLQLEFAQPLPESLELSLVNELGQTLRTHTLPGGTAQFNWSTEQLPAGWYSLRMVMGDAVWVVKVLRK